MGYVVLGINLYRNFFNFIIELKNYDCLNNLKRTITWKFFKTMETTAYKIFFKQPEKTLF